MSFPSRSVHKSWHLIDAAGQVTGRLAVQISQILKGKHKPIFRPNKDCGDAVVVINASKVKFTGKKWDQKKYWWHTGYPGGIRFRLARDMIKRQPTKVLRSAVLGMMQRNKLRHGYLEKNLHIYPGEDHPHEEVRGMEPMRKTWRRRESDFHFGLGEQPDREAKKERSKQAS